MLRLRRFGGFPGAGVEVAVANGSEAGVCEEPQEEQNLAPDWISAPHEEQ